MHGGGGGREVCGVCGECVCMEVEVCAWGWQGEGEGVLT